MTWSIRAGRAGREGLSFGVGRGQEGGARPQEPRRTIKARTKHVAHSDRLNSVAIRRVLWQCFYSTSHPVVERTSRNEHGEPRKS